MHPSNRITRENLDDIFSYHAPKAGQPERYIAVRSAAADFARAIIDNCPDCADRAAAVRQVRQAVMTANASIALEGAEG